MAGSPLPSEPSPVNPTPLVAAVTLWCLLATLSWQSGWWLLGRPAGAREVAGSLLLVLALAGPAAVLGLVLLAAQVPFGGVRCWGLVGATPGYWLLAWHLGRQGTLPTGQRVLRNVCVGLGVVGSLLLVVNGLAKLPS